MNCRLETTRCFIIRLLLTFFGVFAHYRCCLAQQAPPPSTPWYNSFRPTMTQAELVLNRVADAATASLQQGDGCPDKVACRAQCSLTSCGGDLSSYTCSGDYGDVADICGCLPGQWVNFDRSVVALPPSGDYMNIDSQNFVCRSSSLDPVFVNNWADDQADAATRRIFRFKVANYEGVQRVFPGEVGQLAGTCVNSFDIRNSPAFIPAVTGPKNMVVMMPITTSITKIDQTVNPPRSLLDRIKPAVSQLLTTLSAQDYIMVMRYSVGRTESIALPTINDSVFATDQNIATFRQKVEDSTLGLGGGFTENWRDAFQMAFNFLDLNARNVCNNIIIFITDGTIITDPAHDVVIRDRQQRLQNDNINTAHIVAFTIGNKKDPINGLPVAPDHAPKTACDNSGYWKHITDDMNAADVFVQYPRFFYHLTNSIAPRWSNPYSINDGQGTRLTVSRIIAVEVTGSVTGTKYRQPVAIAAVDVRINEYDSLNEADKTALYTGIQEASHTTCDTATTAAIQLCREQVSRSTVATPSTDAACAADLTTCNNVVLSTDWTVERQTADCPLNATAGLNAAFCNTLDPATNAALVPDPNVEYSTLCCNRIPNVPQKACWSPTPEPTIRIEPTYEPTADPTAEPTEAPTEVPIFTFGPVNTSYDFPLQLRGGDAAGRDAFVHAGITPDDEDGRFDRMVLAERLRYGPTGLIAVLIALFISIVLCISACCYHYCEGNTTMGRVTVVEDRIPLVIK